MKVFPNILLFFVVTSSLQGIKSKYLLIRLSQNPGNLRKTGDYTEAIGRSLFRSGESGEQVKFHIHDVEPIPIWNDGGSGGDYHFSCYGPSGTSSEYFAVSRFGTGSYEKPQKTYVVSVSGASTNDTFQKPTGYSRIYKDSGSGATLDGSFWSVSCPAGYGSLSDVCIKGYSQPPLDAIWCVEETYLEADHHDKWIWNDVGSGAWSDCEINGGQSELTKEFIGVTNGGKKTMKKIANKYLDYLDPIYADYKFVGGCEKGEECMEGFVCGGTGNYWVCNHCSFNECNERAMKNQTYAFAYKQRNTDMKKGVCKLCNDKEFSKFERGKDDNHKGWGLYTIKLGMNHGPCGDSHECEGGFQCKDKKENGYGTCK